MTDGFDHFSPISDSRLPTSDSQHNNNEIEILKEGLDILCRDDPDIKSLIAPRQPEIISRLCRYISEIEKRNPVDKLVGTNDRQELIKRHILDSLAPLGIFYSLLKNQGLQPAKIPVENYIPQIADLGSGAGLPGIPLAIAMPDVHFTLIERMARRCGFLRDVQKTLGLTNITVIEAELEKLGHSFVSKKSARQISRVPKAGFNLVTFRAFRSFEPKIVKGLFRLCTADTIITAYKGRREKIDADIAMLEQFAAGSGKNIVNSEKTGKSKFQYSGCEVIPCPVPLLAEERHILVIRS